MLAAARSGEFERVGVIELERRMLLETLPAASRDTRELVAQIAERDRALVALIASARSEVADLLRRARQLQAGAGAYLGIALGR